MNAGTGLIWFFIVLWLAYRIGLWYQRRTDGQWSDDEHRRCPGCGRWECRDCGHPVRSVWDEPE